MGKAIVSFHKMYVVHGNTIRFFLFVFCVSVSFFFSFHCFGGGRGGGGMSRGYFYKKNSDIAWW